MKNKSIKVGSKEQRNNVISARMNEETEYALNKGLKRTGLTRTAYLRLAIIEKNKADSMKE
jgi:predicted DNA-binding protein